MYRVGTAAQFGLERYGDAPTVALPPSNQQLAIWHEGRALYVAQNGEEIDVEDGQSRLAAATLLLILRDPALKRWTVQRTRVLTMFPMLPWALAKLDPFEALVIKRITQIQKLAGITGGEVDSIIWDWEPGQCVGMVAVQLVMTRVFYRFTLRGHTLAYRDHISNVTVPLAREIAIESKMPRPELRGELFPDNTEDF